MTVGVHLLNEPVICVPNLHPKLHIVSGETVIPPSKALRCQRIEVVCNSRQVCSFLLNGSASYTQILQTGCRAISVGLDGLEEGWKFLLDASTQEFCEILLESLGTSTLLWDAVPRGLLKKSCSFWNRSKGPTPWSTSDGVRFRTTNHP